MSESMLYIPVPFSVACDLLSEFKESMEGTNKFDAFYGVVNDEVQKACSVECSSKERVFEYIGRIRSNCADSQVYLDRLKTLIDLKKAIEIEDNLIEITLILQELWATL
ncbi:hypothetical protein V0288_11170 [Pannus brasiliensis CCIBt3594]|uniref:Uncharacterized protein n=1 Tax=Pannus brasiliensis CCIBt3594 TaxID=1427578 RepID=A0AAW9QR30_9CHRO